LAPSEKQGEPTGDSRRVTRWGPFKGQYKYGNTRSDRQRTEKDGKNVVFMGCRHVVGDKRSKNSEGRLQKQRKKVQN
jgi:hypothetical protein